MISAQALLKEIYRGILGRDPDEVGLKAYSVALQGGARLEEIMASMLGSDEFKFRLPEIIIRNFSNGSGALDTEFFDKIVSASISVFALKQIYALEAESDYLKLHLPPISGVVRVYRNGDRAKETCHPDPGGRHLAVHYALLSQAISGN